MKGRERILKVLEVYKQLPLSEIARRAQLAKSTVSYHLDKLVKEGLVEKTEDGQYKLAERNLGRDILKVMGNIASNEGMVFIDVEYVIEKVKKSRIINQNEIEKAIDDLINRGLIRRFGSKIALTKDGAETLGLCVACLKPFEDGDRVLTIEDGDLFGYPRSYKIHLRCLKSVIEEPVEYPYTLPRHESFCHFCGLPLNRERYLELCIPRITPQDLKEALTPEELLALEEDPRIDKNRVLVSYRDIKLFVTELYLSIEGVSDNSASKIEDVGKDEDLNSIALRFEITYSVVEKYFEGGDIRKRSAEIYKKVVELEREYRKEANKAFDQLLDPIGKACNMINVWWHEEPSLNFEDLIDPFRDITKQNLMIKYKGKFFHPYCYELFRKVNKTK